MIVENFNVMCCYDIVVKWCAFLYCVVYYKSEIFIE
jgi:hypothetical protein